MLSARKLKKRLYSGRNAPLMFAVLDAEVNKAIDKSLRPTDIVAAMFSKSPPRDVINEYLRST